MLPPKFPFRPGPGPGPWVLGPGPGAPAPDRPPDRGKTPFQNLGSFRIREGRFQHPGRPVSASGRGLNSHPGFGRFQNPGGARHRIQGSVVFTYGWWPVCETRGARSCSASGIAFKGVFINIISLGPWSQSPGPRSAPPPPLLCGGGGGGGMVRLLMAPTP